MSETLLQNSHGHRPKLVYDIVPGGELAGMDLAAETGVLLAATTAGQLMLISHAGEPVCMEMGFDGVERVAICDSGQYAAIVRDESQLVFLSPRLKSLWSARITGVITSLAIAPHGSHVVLGTDAACVHVVNADRRELCRVETGRPIDFLSFIHERPQFIAAAEFGNMTCFTTEGTEVWQERMGNNAGDLSVSPDGERIVLAAFNHGIQVYDKRGRHLGSFMVDGIPCRASMSANKSRIAAMTLEHRVIWLNMDGNVVWGCDLSTDAPQHVCAGPLGDRMYVGTASGRILCLEW